MGSDYRNYTMISYESWKRYLEETHPFVEIFDTSNCHGTEGPSKTTFSESLHNRMIKSNLKECFLRKRHNILKQ